MKTIYLIHGWGDTSKDVKWFPWLKKELTKRNFLVETPDMPETDEPKIDLWVNKLKQVIKPEKESYIVAHSIGCQTVLRYLEQLTNESKFTIIFIAPWFNLLDTAYEEEDEKRIAQPWLNTLINFKKVNKHIKKLLSVFSKDDFCVPISDSEIFKEKLKSKIIIKDNEKHFDDTKEIKEIIDFIEK